jgi:hypothetical protein
MRDWFQYSLEIGLNEIWGPGEKKELGRNRSFGGFDAIIDRGTEYECEDILR